MTFGTTVIYNPNKGRHKRYNWSPKTTFDVAATVERILVTIVSKSNSHATGIDEKHDDDFNHPVGLRLQVKQLKLDLAEKGLALEPQNHQCHY